MEDLTIEQVIEFAQSIEEESHAFYTRAAGRLRDAGSRTLAEELASAEVDHLNRLRKLLKLVSVAEDDLTRRVKLSTEEYRNVVESEKISDDASAKAILQRALAREKATARTYHTLFAMTNLGPDVVELFSYLSKQEEGHVTMIKNRLAAL